MILDMSCVQDGSCDMKIMAQSLGNPICSDERDLDDSLQIAALMTLHLLKPLLDGRACDFNWHSYPSVSVLIHDLNLFVTARYKFDGCSLGKI